MSAHGGDDGGGGAMDASLAAAVQSGGFVHFQCTAHNKITLPCPNSELTITPDALSRLYPEADAVMDEQLTPLRVGNDGKYHFRQNGMYFVCQSKEARQRASAPILTAEDIGRAVYRALSRTHDKSTETKEELDEGREIRRRVWSNQRERNKQRCTNLAVPFMNITSTAKYTLINFLPKNLFEQFRTKVANVYFLLLVVLLLIPALSNLPAFTTAAPLAGVLAFNALLEAITDRKRHQQDNEFNSTPTMVLRDRKWLPTTWRHVEVGDIIKIDQDEDVPADCLLLSACKVEGQSTDKCYVETRDLDGETNLKTRKPLPSTRDLIDPDALSHLKAKSVGEPPNDNVDHYEGKLVVEQDGGDVVDIVQNQNVLLRGHRLRNTESVCGLVVFASSDTKLMKNSGQTRVKQTQIARGLNKLVLLIILWLFVLCTLIAALNAYWERDVGEDFTIYLPREDVPDNDAAIGALTFFSIFILLSTLVPISLYVAVEFVRQVQSALINWDLQMYHTESDTPARAQSISLNEELGQIEYVFSDKTGTLTDNIMKFLQCIADGNVYELPYVVLRTDVLHSDVVDDINGQIALVNTMVDELATSAGVHKQEIELRVVDPERLFPATSQAAEWVTVVQVHGATAAIRALQAHPAITFTFQDQQHNASVDYELAQTVRESAPMATEDIGVALDEKNVGLTDFFTMCALCHTVERDDSEERAEFQSQSPDENALVGAARDVGFEFFGVHATDHGDYYEIKAMGESRYYRLLNVIPFNSDRKRMSVVLQGPKYSLDPAEHDGPIVLYSKGADSIMHDRLSDAGRERFATTERQLDTFAVQGLRTLVFCKRELPDEFYTTWEQAWHEAGQDLEHLKERLAVEAAKVETDLEFVGASAIEDKLQKGVPDTIANLRRAGIKVWMLTGDKRETAVNIAKACHLFSSDPDICIDGEPWRSWSTEEVIAWASTVVQGFDAARHGPVLAEQNVVGDTLRDLSLDRLAALPTNVAKNLLEVALRLGCTKDGVENQLRAYLRQVEFSENNHQLVIDQSSMDFIITADFDAVIELVEKERAGRGAEGCCGLAACCGCHHQDAHPATGRSDLEAKKQLLDMFVRLSSFCTSVVCCRFRPKQKANVVRAIKKTKRAVTLAVGDGANDVNMIKQAHIGVGISGFEGKQAVAASDFAIGQFRFLNRLLLVHGRYSYMRMGTFIRFFFYKNIVATLGQFWFALVSAYSAQTIYDPVELTLYNVFFTSFGVIAMGILEQDVSPEASTTRYPLLYEAGIRNVNFTTQKFVATLIRGTWHSIVGALVALGVVAWGGSSNSNGLDRNSITYLAVPIGLAPVLITNLQLALMTKHWTRATALSLLIGPLAWLFIFAVRYESDNDLLVNEYTGTLGEAFSSAQFWFGLALTLIAAFMPSLALEYYRGQFTPSPIDIAREKEKMLSKDEKQVKKHEARRARASLQSAQLQVQQSGFPSRSRRSSGRGYAYSHEDNTDTHRFPTRGSVRRSRTGAPESAFAHV
eukprot:m.255083 g.255083  ORF g.255083 m.255083 type:complete len:1504 (+) comp19155_c0_seq3:182-4693(+)